MSRQNAEGPTPAAPSFLRSAGDALAARMNGPGGYYMLAVPALVGLRAVLPPAVASGVDLVLGVIAIVAFAFMLWRGAPAVLAAPVAAAAVVVALYPAAPGAAFETRFAEPAGAFFGQYLAIFVMGAMFGRIMVSSGCAAGLARPMIAAGSPPVALLSIAGLSAVMTLGGVGVFVIAFAVHPIASRVMERARLPRALGPAAIAFGAFTFTMTALPGAPSLTNIVAGAALGTSAFAAPSEGLVAAAVMAVFGFWWLWRAARTAPRSNPSRPAPETPADEPEVRSGLAALPLVVTLLANMALTGLAPGLGMETVSGGWGATYWSVLAALALGIATALAVGRASGAVSEMATAASVAMMPLAGTALCVGFGTVLASSAGLKQVFEALVAGLGAGSAAFAAAMASLCALVTGSSSAGLALALDLKGADLVAAGALTAEEIHRFASLGASTLDTLPHSAAVVSLLAICGLSHAAAYRGVFMTTVVGPTLGLLVALLL